MKRFTFFTVIGLITTALVLQAAPQRNQNRQGREMDVDQRIAQMQKRLDLTPDQSNKIRSILQTQNDKIRDLRSRDHNGSSGRTAAAKEMRQIRQDSMKE